MTDNYIKQAINGNLSAIHVSQHSVNQIMSNITKGKKVKRKLSVAFILTIVLILLSALALAAVAFGWKDAAFYLAKESTEGSYITWSGAEKVELVQSLIEGGYIEENSNTIRLYDVSLSEKEKSTLADTTITQWLSNSIDTISFLPIMERIWGNFRTWSLQQKAWYSQTMIDAGVQQADFEIHVMPDDSVLTQDEAKRLAILYAEIWLGLPKGTIPVNNIICNYVILPHKKLHESGTSEYTTQGVVPVWLLELQWQNETGDTESCTTEVNPVSGIVDIQYFLGKIMYEQFGVDWNQDEAAKAIGALLNDNNYQSFLTWSFQEKARWSDDVRPLVIHKEKSNQGYYHNIIKAMSYYHYGVPDSTVISENDALLLAENHLRDQLSFMKTKDSIPQQSLALYDITDQENPIWRLHFSMEPAIAVKKLNDLYELVFYTIEIDAKSGDVILFQTNALIECTPFERLLLWM